jgi:hypothetical protein
MFDHSDVLIVGDSFAKNRDSESDWPKLLCKLLTDSNKIPRGQGFGGASWWSTRKCLLAELEIKVPEVLVICHTEAMRIPSDFDFGINVASASKWPVVVPAGQEKNYVAQIRDAAAMYYTYLASSEYSNWAQLAWYHELEQMLIKHTIPHVIHLHCFPPGYGQTVLHCFKIGHTVQTALWDMCQDVDQSTARNHFTTEQNVKIAHSINNTLVATPQNVGWIDINLIG